VSKSAEEQVKQLIDRGAAGDLDISAMAEIANSAAGKAFLRKMGGPVGDTLRKTASQAAEGDAAAVSQVLRELLATEEGKALAGQVMAMKRK